MDQTQSKAIAALQPFLHLALTTKSPSPRFLADLIIQATSAQGTYVFTELLQTPAIQSLRTADTPTEFQAHLKHLEIFSYGTYNEYTEMPNLPVLTPPQATKLRQLTLLTLASTLNLTSLHYSTLLTALSLPTIRALEDLLTTSIYASLLTARLSPTSTPPTVHITSVAPLRDLAPASLLQLLSVLQTWESRCNGVISSLNAQISDIQSTALQRKTQARKRQEMVDNAVLTKAEQMQADGGEPGKVTAGGMSLRGRKGVGNKRDLDQQQEGDEEDGTVWEMEGEGEEGMMDLDDVGTGGLRGEGVGRSAKKRGGGRKS